MKHSSKARKKTKETLSSLSLLFFLKPSLYAFSDSNVVKAKTKKGVYFSTLKKRNTKRILTVSLIMNQKASVSKELNAKHRKVFISLYLLQSLNFSVEFVSGLLEQVWILSLVECFLCWWVWFHMVILFFGWLKNDGF